MTRAPTSEPGKSRPQGSARARALLALLPPIVALALQLLAWSLIDPYVWFLFFPAVFASSWIGGFRAGLRATALSTAIVWWVFMPPRYEWAGKGSQVLLPIALFIGMGVLISIVHGRLRRANEQAAAALAAQVEANEALEGAYAEISVLYERTRELDDVKSQLFANLSHELRTPLALILAPAEHLLDRDDLVAAARDQVELIDRNGRVLLEQINDLLEAATLHVGGPELRYAEVDVAALLRVVADDSSATAEALGTEVLVDAPDAITAELDGDVVHRVLSKLVGNALKFAPEGVVRLSATVPEGGTTVRVEVGDSGPGIPLAERETVFEPFRQADGTMTRQVGGAGLGLAIARALVEALGGTLVADAAPEGGALLVMVLPRQAPPGVPVRVEPHGVGEEAHGLDDARSHPSSVDGAPLVLVVEDSADLRFLVEATLASDYEVITAVNGNDGLAVARATRPDVVVTDLMMPEMSGDELIRAIRATPELEATRIVVLTARADPLVHAQLLEHGADDVVVKPFSVAAFLARIASQVAAKHRGDQQRIHDLEREELLARSESTRSLLRATLDSAVDGIVTITPDGTIIEANPAAHAMFGYPDGSLLGREVTVLMPPTIGVEHAGYVERYVTTGVAHIVGRTRAVTGRRSDGTDFPVDLRVADIHEPGMPRLFTAILHDASERMADEAAVRQLALTDPLTGAANRIGVMERLSHALHGLRGATDSMAVLFMDLDRFKNVNDTLGHAVGDEVLCSVVSRLAAILRPTDLLGRLGGDEFVVVCGDSVTHGSTESIVERIELALAAPHLIAGQTVQVTASIGIVEVADPSITAEEVLQRADAAMYRAKTAGRNRHQWYDEMAENHSAG